MITFQGLPPRWITQRGFGGKEQNIMIKTKTALKREARNTRIERMYKDLMGLPGSMKSAVVEQIAKDLKTSVTTVNRIVKPLSVKAA